MSPEFRDPAHLWDMLDAALQGTEIVAGIIFIGYPAQTRSRTRAGNHRRGCAPHPRANPPSAPGDSLETDHRATNILAHEDGRIDHVQLYRIATEEPPDLVAQLRQILPAGAEIA